MSNDMVASLFKPITNKSSSRKVWSIDMETVWIPLFTASNAEGKTSIANSALGAPLRLGYNPDGSVKFSKAGKPVITVAKEISQSVRMVRENFIAGLQSYTHEVYTTKTEAYKAEVQKSIEAGKPIASKDTQALTDAIERIKAQVKTEADKADKANKDQAIVNQAIAHAEASNSGNTQKPTSKVKV